MTTPSTSSDSPATTAKATAPTESMIGQPSPDTESPTTTSPHATSQPPQFSLPLASASHGLRDRVRQVVDADGTYAAVWREVLLHLRERWETPYTAVRVVTRQGMTSDEAFEEGAEPVHWRAMVNTELTQAVLHAKPTSRVYRDGENGLEVGIHAVPVIDGSGHPCGALGLVTDAMPAALCRTVQEQLTGYLELCLEAGWDPDQHEPADSQDDSEKPPTFAFAPFEGASFASRFGSIEELAFGLTNSVKTHWGCSEVALGVVRGKRVRLAAISAHDHVQQRTPAALQLRQAMEECLDQGGLVYAQSKPLGTEAHPGLTLPIHQQLSDLTSHSSCVSIALGNPEAPSAVLTLRRDREHPFSNEDIEQLRAQLATTGDAIAIVSFARRGILRHSWDATLQGLRLVFGSTLRRRALAVTALSLSVWGLASPWSYRVTTDAAINSEAGRIYAVPMDGRLATVHVLPGEPVNAGQLLFEMDTSEIELELQSARSEANLHRVRMVDALRNHDPTAAAAEQELMRAAETEMARLEQQLNDARVFANDDGVVVESEGHLRTGERLPFSQPVLQVAENRGREVELRIDDMLASELSPGMTGWFAAAGEPDNLRPLTITRVEGKAEVEEGRNLVSVWAQMDEQAKDLPMGAKGFAQIEAGQRPGWWILLHKPLRNLRWQLWPL